MTLRVYNTLTRQKENFETLRPGEVRMYVCGPTVYDHAHVGHAMSSIVFDIIRRYLEYQGYDVIHVMNYTDVEDKIIMRAKELGKDPVALAEGYIREYEEHLEALNILHPTITPRATLEMAGIITIIRKLVEKGYAYPSDGDVYFRVSKDEDYGHLSGQRTENMIAGTRVEVEEKKENPLDFTLWKAAKPDEPSWDSPWGAGRPGWHIECTAMCLHYLGEQVDLHGGGNDLIFPHHENEIAQSESFTDTIPFATYWVHNGMLQLKGEPMSKSLGNMVTIYEYLQEHSADSMRMLILSSHYRSPLMFTKETVANTERTVARLQSALRPPTGAITKGEAADALREQIATSQAGFAAAMDDDFNTSSALTSIFDLLRVINIARDAEVGGTPFVEAQTAFREITGVLGLTLEMDDALASEDVAPLITLLIETRAELREAKQFALADRIRDRLIEMDILLEDGAKGTTWRKV